MPYIERVIISEFEDSSVLFSIEEIGKVRLLMVFPSFFLKKQIVKIILLGNPLYFSELEK